MFTYSCTGLRSLFLTALNILNRWQRESQNHKGVLSSSLVITTPPTPLVAFAGLQRRAGGWDEDEDGHGSAVEALQAMDEERRAWSHHFHWRLTAHAIHACIWFILCVYVYMHMFTTTFCVHLYQDLWLNVTDVNIIEGCICTEAAVTPLSGLHSSSWADLRSVAECVTALCVISNLSSVLIHIAAVGVGLYSYCEAAFQCVGIRFAS